MRTYMRRTEAARFLGISISRLKQLAKQGRIGALVTGRYLFSTEELRAFKKQPRKNGAPFKKKPGD